MVGDGNSDINVLPMVKLKMFAGPSALVQLNGHTENPPRRIETDKRDDILPSRKNIE